MADLPAFNPLHHLPERMLPTASRIAAIQGYFDANGVAPTEPQVVALIGAAIPTPAYTDPLPDNFAGRNWRNPNWLKRLVQASS